MPKPRKWPGDTPGERNRARKHAYYQRMREQQPTLLRERNLKAKAKRQEKRKMERREYYQKYGRRDWLRDKYSLTEEEYKILAESQNYTCAICKTPQSGLDRKLSVDHCHKTGKIRALLCKSCNWMLGWAKDNKETLQSAIKYLENYGSNIGESIK